MFKDYDKYLTTSIKVYLFVLIIIFILKMVGLDYFGIDINSSTMITIQSFLEKHWIIRDIIYFIPLFLNQFTITTVSCNSNSKEIKIYLLCLAPIFYIFESYKLIWFGNFAMIFELLYLIIIASIYNRKISLKLIKKTTLTTLTVIIIQMISTFTRFRYSVEYVENIVANLVLNLDYIVMLIIMYKLYFMKGGTLCYQEAQCSFLLKKLNFKNLLKRLQKNWHNFRKLDKVTKLTYIIYFILSLIWNTLSVVLILFVACLNDTLIECIFILTSFWLSKGKFGKAFHFSSMSKCFIVSNLSYYVLNRITTPLGISILVPILLGVGLSYVTSKFVKKTYKPLYRGMPEELFEETILKVVDKDSLKYKICYDFYMKKKSIISLAMKYNYTEAGIRKIKDRVNDKIKRLN